MDALAEVCEPGTNLILLGAVNDIEIYRALTRRGVADYLVLPCAPARLVEAILELYADPAKAPKGQAIAVIGARGGAGASSLAHNLAHVLAKPEGSDALLADLDLAFGSADLAFNVETTSGIRNLLADPERIDEVFIQRFAARLGDRLHLLAAPALLDADVRVDARALEAAVDAMRQHVRHVVLDLPHQWNEWVRQTLRQADQVVIVTTGDLAGVRNARNLLDVAA
ncbi:AAA family ATPase, partial [Azospirillum sp.]|uniref:AAA family ATPase n=1 Tax=Azospirillum sp. TaxID=34012 RepID=UPI002D3A550D